MYILNESHSYIFCIYDLKRIHDSVESSYYIHVIALILNSILNRTLNHILNQNAKIKVSNKSNESKFIIKNYINLNCFLFRTFDIVMIL